jgi:hypothetical protein
MILIEDHIFIIKQAKAKHLMFGCGIQYICGHFIISLKAKWGKAKVEAFLPIVL